MNDGENAREVRGPRKVRLLRQISGAAMTAGVLQVFANFAASQEVLDNIIVTGSRIERTSATTATPTTAVDAEQIGQTGELNLGEILKEVPALTAGIDSQSVGLLTFTPETVGVNQANLRGLGTDRTLVLVNGRRHVGSSPGSAAVDMNAIPTAMVERVDVITGGASAVYGADAVTGVINVILKEDFEGLEASAQYGMSERRDAEQLAFNVVAGSNFDNDKGNVYASFSYHDEEGIRGNDRADFWQPRIGFRPNPANTGPADGIPDRAAVTSAAHACRSTLLPARVPRRIPNSFSMETAASRPLPAIPIRAVRRCGSPVRRPRGLTIASIISVFRSSDTCSTRA